MRIRISWIVSAMLLSALGGAIASKTLLCAVDADGKEDGLEVLTKQAIFAREIHLVDDNGNTRILLEAISDTPAITLVSGAGEQVVHILSDGGLAGLALHSGAQLTLCGRTGPTATLTTSDNEATMKFWRQTASGLMVREIP
jgi:hypothetical protein